MLTVEGCFACQSPTSSRGDGTGVFICVACGCRYGITTEDVALSYMHTQALRRTEESFTLDLYTQDEARGVTMAVPLNDHLAWNSLVMRRRGIVERTTGYKGSIVFAGDDGARVKMTEYVVPGFSQSIATPGLIVVELVSGLSLARVLPPVEYMTKTWTWTLEGKWLDATSVTLHRDYDRSCAFHPLMQADGYNKMSLDTTGIEGDV